MRQEDMVKQPCAVQETLISCQSHHHRNEEEVAGEKFSEAVTSVFPAWDISLWLGKTEDELAW